MKSKKHFSTQKIKAAPYILLMIVLIALFNACSLGSGSEKLTVGKSGNLNSINIPANAAPVIKFAAAELQEYLELITGVRLPVVESERIGRKEKGISLSPVEQDGIVWDGFIIAADNNGIVIKANQPRGILYGVYQLLEDAGCLFVYPGKQEEAVPHLESVEFIPGERVFNPTIEHRGLTPYSLQASTLELGRDFIDWMAKNKMNYILVSENRKTDCPDSAHSSIWKEVTNELLPELQKRGFVIEMAEHTIDIFFPRSLFKEHPEWFALIKGKRRIGDENDPYTGQMCYSNKNAVEYYAAAVANYAANRPEFHIIGTWPRDGGQWCECDLCQNNLNVLYDAIKIVAEKVKQVRPDIAVEYMIYPRPKGFQPPPETLPENMSFLWIPDNGQLDSLGKVWSRKSNLEARGTYQFEYLMGDNYRSRTNVWLNPVLAVNNARHARDMEFKGVTSLFLPLENWWRAAFNNWFFARACWSENLDVNLELHEYCIKYYGKFAGETEAVFHRILNELQADQSLMIYTGNDDKREKYMALVPVAGSIIERIEALINRSQEPDVVGRLMRLKAYVEYFMFYYKGLATQEEGSLARLADFSRNNPELNMVLMSPEYIKWRNNGLIK